jgi:23S rRNA pseudouridine1911/1915/1917 synthase
VRLDQELRAAHPGLSWARIRRAIARGQVTVGGAVERDPAAVVDSRTVVSFDPNRPALPGARLDLPRLYEDEHILVVDKPAGLLTIPSRPGAGSEDTILARVRDYVAHRAGRRAYVGVLHRLDRGTSGALALALTRDAHRRGRELFRAHRFVRKYLALVDGVPRERRGTIRAPVSEEYVAGRRRVARRGERSRPAVTDYRVREAWQTAALVELTLETGRQHQIRLHLQQLGHPVLGETVYREHRAGGARRPGTPGRGTPPGARRVMLHAWQLEFPHPVHETRVRVEAPLPPDFHALVRRLRARAARV